MKPPAAISLLLLLASLACTTARPPGTYKDSGPFHSNTLHLGADGTFSYQAWSDDGGTHWRAEGTWTWIDSRRLDTTITTITPLSATHCGPLQHYQVWRLTLRGLIRDTAPFTRRRDDT